MVLYVPCFGVSFCTVSPSVCLDDIYLGLGSLVAIFWEELLIQSTIMFSLLCLLVVLVVANFGFEGRTLVLIAQVPGHYLPFTYYSNGYTFLVIYECFKCALE